ncbi:hypothetical protein BJY04DRAFT_7314 [Aspergillus karnatakaensis]|uniref:DUF3712 domain-containing protein n=1 Tax=Aspergillus karnatakaensis TaxID=1810916 RepID=UPI003CCDFF15
MADKAAVEEVPVDVTSKPTFWTKVKAHFKKWWWAHLIAFCAIVLIIALPLVYVGYPNIAQEDIDESTLTVESMEISDPAPNGFHLNQRQVIGSGSIFHPRIYSFDAEVSLQGSPPFATVTVPSVRADDGVELVIDQWLELSDTGAFADFSTAVMMNEEFQLHVVGEPDLKLGALPKISVDYDKTVTMKGLNKLAGFKIEELNMDPNRDDGNNANGTVFIPNPSVLRLAMGNITLDVSANGTAVGQSFLNDLVLEPGDNHVPMLSTLSTRLLIPFLDGVDSTIPLTIVGNSSVYNGEEIPYFTAALAANELVVDLNLLSVLGE